MWSKKKPDAPQAADTEQTGLQTNWPPKPVSGSWEGTTKMNTDVTRPAVETADRAPSRLGPSLHLKGEISGNEDLDIDGTVEGLVCIDERRLTVGATAKLTADIMIKKDGSVNGDLTTAQIIIEDGAYFKGSIEIERSAEREGDKNVSSQTASASATPSAGSGPKSI
jgi:cytoskeletal protein CcmA (bactofilin family)